MPPDRARPHIPGMDRGRLTGLVTAIVAEVVEKVLISLEESGTLTTGLAAQQRPGARTLQAIVTTWEQDLQIRLGVSDEHARRCAKSVRELIEFCGWVVVDDLDPQHTLRYLSDAITGGMGIKTARNRLSQFRQWGQYLVEAGHWPDNRFARLRLPRISGKPKGAAAFTAEEVDRLCAAAKERRHTGIPQQRSDYPREDLYRLLYLTGLRRLEARAQRWEDVDLERGTLIVSRDKSRRRDIMPLSPDAVAILRRLRALSPNGDKVLSQWVDHTTMRRDMEAAGIACQGDGVRGYWHRLRKAAVTERAKAGASLAELAKFARHTSTDVTLSSYVDLRTEDMRGVAELLDRSRENREESVDPTGRIGDDGAALACSHHEEPNQSHPDSAGRAVECSSCRQCDRSRDPARPTDSGCTHPVRVSGNDPTGIRTRGETDRLILTLLARLITERAEGRQDVEDRTRPDRSRAARGPAQCPGRQAGQDGEVGGRGVGSSRRAGGEVRPVRKAAAGGRPRPT